MWQQALKGRSESPITLAGALLEFTIIGYYNAAPHLLDHSGCLEPSHDRSHCGALNAETLRPQLSNEEPLSQFAAQVEGMHAGLARVSADALVRRAKTGLDEEVKPADEDLSPPERVRNGA